MNLSRVLSVVLGLSSVALAQEHEPVHPTITEKSAADLEAQQIELVTTWFTPNVLRFSFRQYTGTMLSINMTGEQIREFDLNASAEQPALVTTANGSFQIDAVNNDLAKVTDVLREGVYHITLDGQEYWLTAVDWKLMEKQRLTTWAGYPVTMAMKDDLLIRSSIAAVILVLASLCSYIGTRTYGFSPGVLHSFLLTMVNGWTMWLLYEYSPWKFPWEIIGVLIPLLTAWLGYRSQQRQQDREIMKVIDTYRQ